MHPQVLSDLGSRRIFVPAWVTLEASKAKRGRNVSAGTLRRLFAVGRNATRADRARYDGLSMTLHWLTALLVVAQFGLAEAWGFAPPPARRLMIVAHMSFGILLALVLIVRIGWRLTPGHQVRGLTMGWVHVASRAMEYGLYGLLAIEVALGFLLRWSGGEALSFFGVAVPSPFSGSSKAVHHLVGDAHNWIAWTIVILATGHGLAALVHHFVLRDDVLRRMLPGRHWRRQAARGRSRSPMPEPAPSAPGHTA